MSTATVSASVDTRTKAIANAYIRKSGKTPNQLIKDLWEHIARTGEVPSYAEPRYAREQERVRRFDEMTAMLEAASVRADVAAMSDDELKRAVRYREL